jgi:hypothetical protein
MVLSEERKAKMLEGRMNALKKPVIYSIIKAHCFECKGSLRYCQGHKLLDGSACPLYPVGKRRMSKPEVKKAIRECCTQCLGSPTDICVSPDCNLYAIRFGRWANYKEE